VLMHPRDAARLGLRPGDPVRLWNPYGELRGRVFLADVKPGTLQVHWPEGNALAAPEARSPLAGIPAYKGIFAFVERANGDAAP
jgi:anaerobic selenocysteine-containing dehydrogenase